MDLIDVASWRTPATDRDLGLSPGERYVAGGTWLFSEPQPEVSGLVDLTTLGWEPWTTLAGGGLRIAATCTIAQLQEAPWGPLAGLVRQAADALLMSWKVQDAATVGGNVALALPAGAMTSLLAGLGARVVVWSVPAVPGASDPEPREPAAETHLCSDFVTGVGTTLLRPGQVIRAFEVPAEVFGARTAYRRLALVDRGRSASVVVGRTSPAGLVVTLTAATPAPVVISVATVDEIVAGVRAIDRWHDDAHGAPDWRAAVSERLAAEVAEELLS